MAEETTSRRRRSAADTAGDAAAAAVKADNAPPTPAEERKPTKRVVLRRERVIVLPDDVTDEVLGKLGKGEGARALADLLGLTGKVATADLGREMWLVVGEFEGTDKEDAIRAHAGEPGTPDAIPGTYKAPPVNGWKGGKRYVRPDRPKVEAENID